MVKHCHRFPREVVDDLSLETFTVRWDGALRNLIKLKMSLLIAEWGWTRWPLKAPSKPNWWFCDSMLAEANNCIFAKCWWVVVKDTVWVTADAGLLYVPEPSCRGGVYSNDHISIAKNAFTHPHLNYMLMIPNWPLSAETLQRLRAFALKVSLWCLVSQILF